MKMPYRITENWSPRKKLLSTKTEILVNAEINVLKNSNVISDANVSNMDTNEDAWESVFKKFATSNTREAVDSAPNISSEDVTKSDMDTNTKHDVTTASVSKDVYEKLSNDSTKRKLWKPTTKTNTKRFLDVDDFNPVGPACFY